MWDFRDLRVWEKPHCLTLSIHKVTEAFPRDEIYGLTSHNSGVLVRQFLLRSLKAAVEMESPNSFAFFGSLSAQQASLNTIYS